MNTPQAKPDTASIRSNPPVNLSLQEAAAYLGVSSKTIRRQATAGAVRAARFGKRLIFTRAELDRAIAVSMAVA